MKMCNNNTFICAVRTNAKTKLDGGLLSDFAVICKKDKTTIVHFLLFRSCTLTGQESNCMQL